MSRLLGIGVCQLETDVTNIQQNMESLRHKLESCAPTVPGSTWYVHLNSVSRAHITWNHQLRKFQDRFPEFCADLARKHEIYLIPGSLYEKEGQAIYNTAPVLNPQGKLIARYRKMYPWRPFEKTTSGA